MNTPSSYHTPWGRTGRCVYSTLVLIALCMLFVGVHRQLSLHAATPAHPTESLYRPDPTLTPGVACPNVTVEDLRSPQFIKDARSKGTKDGKQITEKEKREVYAEYGITSHVTGEYEVDHLISLELGGSNDIKNLWPQPYHGTWNAHQKDRLENELHRRVLDGRMSLQQAQHQIATDWVACYCTIYPDEVTGGAPKAVGKQPNNEADLDGDPVAESTTGAWGQPGTSSSGTFHVDPNLNSFQLLASNSGSTLTLAPSNTSIVLQYKREWLSIYGCAVIRVNDEEWSRLLAAYPSMIQHDTVTFMGPPSMANVRAADGTATTSSTTGIFNIKSTTESTSTTTGSLINR